MKKFNLNDEAREYMKRFDYQDIVLDVNKYTT